LVHFSFGLEEDGTIFCVIVGFSTVVNALRRLEGVRASAVTVASAWCATSLVVLILHVIKSSLTSFLQGWPEIIFPVLYRPRAMGANPIYLLGIAALIVVIARWPWSFIMLGCVFSTARACGSVAHPTY
jgi:hypothetical protein